MGNEPKPTAKQMELFQNSTGKIERRNFQTIFKRAEADGRTVEGYAAIFNSETDLGWYTEVIEAGAFDNALKTSDCRALFNHDANHLLARQSSNTLQLSTDEKGLMYGFESPGTSTGNDILEMMDRGDLRESSFAFTVKEQTWEEEKDDNGDWHYRRVIKEVEELHDVSPVTYPAYKDTTVAKRSLDAWKETHPTEEETITEGTEETAAQRGYDPAVLRLIFG